MYGLSTLKPGLAADEAAVSCPVRGCGVTVPRQQALARVSAEYQCPVHRIYLSATGFRYERETDNLLWCDRESLALLNASRLSLEKRSFGADSSEDAVAWNVFRWLELAGLLPEALERMSGRPIFSTNTWYWGRAVSEEGVPFALRRARAAFGEDAMEGTDLTTPAVTVESDDTLLVVDPRLTSFRRVPAAPADGAGYARGGDGWASRVLRDGWPEQFSERAGRELIRLWLIGSYAAHLLEKDFVLLHIVPAWAGSGARGRVAPALQESEGRRLIAASWEDVHGLAVQRPGAPQVEAVLTYFREKSAGYDDKGRLLRCFQVPASVSAGRTETRVS